MSSSEKPVEPPKSQHLDSEDTQKIESEPTKIQIPANGEDQEVGLVPNYNKNIPLSLLYLQFASLGGSIEAKASMAAKIYNGHNTPPNCQKSISYWKAAAHSQILGLTMGPQIRAQTDHVVLSDEYKSGTNILDDEKDIIEYHLWEAEKGSIDSLIAIGVICYQGGIGGLAQDYEKAFYYLNLAKQRDPEDARALLYLGYLYHQGKGVSQNNETAAKLFTKSYKAGRESLDAVQQQASAEAGAQLGIMTLHGYGVVQSRPEGMKLLEAAAADNDDWALLQLGRYTYSGAMGLNQNIGQARAYFQRSAQQGNLIATFNLAQTQSTTSPTACTLSSSYYRKILDKTLHRQSCVQAFGEYSKGNFERALIRYEIAADQGSILAQKNAAWLYEMGLGVGILGQFSTDTQLKYRNAFRFYQLAAEQSSATAHLKLGDYKFYGLGTEVDIPLAAQYYQVGSDLRSPQATFNIGWMHQKGLGLPKDFHLAKRYYDLAIEINKEAYVPAMLALASLAVEYGIDYLAGDGLILGYQWDSVLLGVLLVILVVTLIIRSLLLPDDHYLPHPQQQQGQPQQGGAGGPPGPAWAMGHAIQPPAQPGPGPDDRDQ